MRCVRCRDLKPSAALPTFHSNPPSFLPPPNRTPEVSFSGFGPFRSNDGTRRSSCPHTRCHPLQSQPLPPIPPPQPFSQPKTTTVPRCTQLSPTALLLSLHACTDLPTARVYCTARSDALLCEEGGEQGRGGGGGSWLWEKGRRGKTRTEGRNDDIFPVGKSKKKIIIIIK